MIRNVITQISGVGWYGIVSLLIFFVFFVGVIIWTVRLKKGYIQEMSSLPMQPDQTPSTGGAHHE